MQSLRRANEPFIKYAINSIFVSVLWEVWKNGLKLCILRTMPNVL